MENVTFDRRSLRLSGTLMLAGQLLYIIVTLFHAGGDANNHHDIFAIYAANAIWTTVHLAQFAAMAILLAGLFALFFALDNQARPARWAARFGAATTVATLALYGVVQAVDGVALKQAVNAWANAPETEKAARFATAEALRWLEWGTRSYQNFALAFAFLLFAAALARTAGMPRLVASLMALSSLTYVAQGWIGATEGFTQRHASAIVLSWVLNLLWMSWLIVASSRAQRLTEPDAVRTRPAMWPAM
ncbi:MAG TPA: hypothetical protein VFC10_06190 [Terriglobia bacterium]|nr:hypothetical protein [Terriglobia bacterium]